MTRNTSFGPVLLVVALPEPLRSTVAPIFVVDKNELRKNLISKKKARKNKHVLVAQTTRFTSFGPVLPVAAFPEPLHTFNVSIVTVNIFSYRKKKHEEKKNSPNGPNDTSHVVWAIIVSSVMVAGLLVVIVVVFMLFLVFLVFLVLLMLLSSILSLWWRLVVLC